MTEFEPKIVAFDCNWCTYAGADLTAGLRAGALDVEPRPGHIGLPGVVKLAEISGSDTYVHAQTAAGDVVAQFGQRLGDIPFITPFTFGEQGRLPHGELAHGNLMISSVIFLDS